FHPAQTSYMHPLSLHDALPILEGSGKPGPERRYIFRRGSRASRSPSPMKLIDSTMMKMQKPGNRTQWGAMSRKFAPSNRMRPQRSEEHTSELQSRENLVCRLLL